MRMRSEVRFWSLVSAAAMMIALVLVPSVASADTSGTLLVTSDTTLTQDHVGDIWFVADNVTLDLAGDAFTRTREDFGILLVGSSQNAFVANTVDLSTAEGILLDGASNGNIFQANAVLRSGGGGVTVLGSSSNSIIENRVMFNRAGGISLLAGSSDNVVRRNISCRNGNVDAYDDLTGTGNVWGMSRFCTSQNI
jgi:parallel beta-helix repeat protein